MPSLHHAFHTRGRVTYLSIYIFRVRVKDPVGTLNQRPGGSSKDQENARFENNDWDNSELPFLKEAQSNIFCKNKIN